MSSIDATDSLPPPDGCGTDRRFLVQICFPEAGAAEEWETVRSYDTLREAIHGASDCCELVKEMSDLPWHSDLPPGVLRIRVYDSERERAVLWETEEGGLAGEWRGRDDS